VRPIVTTPVARTGLGAAPALGGLCWALVAWEARRARGGPRPYQHPHTGDATLGPAGAPPIHIAWLGDSLAAGLGADSVDDTPAHLVAHMLERPVRVSVLAVPGARALHVREQQLPAMGDRADLVVLCVGANDVASSTSRREYARDLDAILAATAPTPTVVLSVPDLAVAVRMAQPLRTLAGLRAQWFEVARARIAARHRHVTSVDIASRPPGVSRRDARALLCADRFHPSGEGYRVWAERISMTCEQLLTARQGVPAG
jgi:lysophospholipase L1-like esterase